MIPIVQTQRLMLNGLNDLMLRNYSNIGSICILII